MTPTQRLAGLLLGEPVTPWINRRRAEGASFRAISRELFERTNGQIDLAHETLRLWTNEDAA